MIALKGFLKSDASKIYLWVTSFIGCGLFIQVQDIHGVLRYSGKEFSLLLLLVIALCLLALQRILILLPPKGNTFSLDSSIYLASIFTFGLEITLFLLLVTSLFDDFKQKRTIWQLQLFNFSTYTLMISCSYYLFVLSGGDLSMITWDNSTSYALGSISYYFVNIAVVGLYFSLKSPIGLLPLLKETIPEYAIIIALSLILSILLNSHPIFGVILFTLVALILSHVFRRYFALYQEVSNDRTSREQILNSLPIGIITIDHMKKNISLNTSASRLLDMNEETVEILMAQQKDSFIENEGFWKLLHMEKGFQNVKVSYNTRTSTNILLVSHSELVSQHGETIGSIYFFIDVTEFEEMEQRMHQSEKLAILGEISAGAAHEIRNPLTVIEGFLTLMKESFSESEKNRFHIPFLLKEFDRINTIVEEMLLLAKPGEPKLEEVYVKDMVEEVISNYSQSNPASEVTFNIHLDDTKLPLDTKQMVQVLYNLIRNSSEAISDNGTITIKSSLKRDSYLLYVEDNGAGIPTELQDTIFKPFLTSKDNGTGLGLSIVQRIIENHNGKIELHSSSVRGTAFLITLPLSRAR